MKKLVFSFGLILTIAFASCSGNSEKDVKDSDISKFLGQWSFNLGTKEGVPNTVGWLEVKKEGDFWEADLLWGGGGIVPVQYLYFADDVLYLGRSTRQIVLQKDAEGKPIKTQYLPSWQELRVDGDNLTGYELTPNSSYVGLDTVIIKGKRMPPMPPAPDIANLKFDDPINLIKNPNSLEGWTLVEENGKSGWSMEDGVLTNNPVQIEGQPHIWYANLKTEQEFEDFNLKLDIKVHERSNSGIYLRGMVEVQVSDSYDRPIDKHGTMGAIFSRITPTVNAARPAEEWQTMDITYVDRHVTVKLNDITVIDNQPVYGPTGGAIYYDMLLPGPIYLQGDHTKATFRNIILTPIIK